MDDSVRTLKWSNGIFKFPCGIEVKLTEKKLIWILNTFKLEEEMDNIFNTGQMTIPKEKAFQIRSYLT